MEIKTKYNIGQVVYARLDAIFPQRGRIEKIAIQVGESRINGDAPRINYKIQDWQDWIPETALYGTIAEAKGDALKALNCAFKELEDNETPF